MTDLARRVRVLAIVAPVLVLLVPWARRLKTPSLVADDVARVIDLQTLTLGERMIRPFNEHLAPWFELVTAATWESAGRQLSGAPMAFTVASYVPFVLSLGMLWVLARREWRSPTVAWLAVVLFAATPIYAECVFWFSASTFTWALLFTIVAAWLAGLARDRGSVGFAAGSAVACLLAPMGSAIGLLAGPVAMIRCLPERRPASLRRSLGLSVIPASGTAAYLAFASLFKYQDVLARSSRDSRDIASGLYRAIQAPLWLVLSGYARVVEPDRSLPYGAFATFVGVGLVAIALKAWRSPANDRRWLAIGALLVGVGYPMIYCFRTKVVGDDSVLSIQRYHLFPCLGLVLILTAWLAPRVRRLDARPIAGPILLLTLTTVLVAVNRPTMTARLGYFRMYPDQGSTLAMMDHLADVARTRGLSRTQILAAFGPVEPRWTAPGWDALRMLPMIPVDHPNGLTDDEVRQVVTEALSPGDRARLLADRDATRWLGPDESSARTTGRLVATLRMHPGEVKDLYRSDGWPTYLEYAFERDGQIPRGLALPGLPPGKTFEVCWDDGSRTWPAERRAIVRLAPGQHDRVLPLDRLPGMDVARVRRVRIAVREPGPVAIGAPAMVR